ncbi:MAG: hypothetical protein JNM82_10235 [Rhodocyclaceae bacterium]|nr:hypothetical protein [Rhodocyclaceae bacterium]
MRLDLTGTERLAPEDAAELDGIAEEMRRPFVDFIESLGSPYGADVDWWVTGLGSRNTYACPLFLRLCQLELVRRRAAGGHLAEVAVDSHALGEVLRGCLPGSVRIVAPGPLASLAGDLYGMLRRISASLVRGASRYFASRLHPRRSPLPQSPVVLVDTFLYADTLGDDGVSDRHYPGLLECLSPQERAAVRLLPTLYKPRSLGSLFRRLRLAEDVILVPEDFLRPADYAFAIGHAFRSFRMGTAGQFRGVDVGPLLGEARRAGFAGSGSIEGLLRYRFARRAAAAGLRVSRVIEWFENQEIDHGAIAGWRRYFPGTRVVGYQGFFAARSYLCMFPTASERRAEVLPDELAVMGPALMDTTREFLPDGLVGIAPAFRFAPLLRAASRMERAKARMLLIALPIMRRDAEDLIDMVHGALSSLSGNEPWRIGVKAHPGDPGFASHACATLATAGECAVVTGVFLDLLSGAAAFVGAASSTCVEAVALGVPTALVGARGRPTQNPIPPGFPGGEWRICHSPEQLAEFLATAALAPVPAAGDQAERLAPWLAQVSPKAVRSFLGLDTQREIAPAC